MPLGPNNFAVDLVDFSKLFIRKNLAIGQDQTGLSRLDLGIFRFWAPLGAQKPKKQVFLRK